MAEKTPDELRQEADAEEAKGAERATKLRDAADKTEEADRAQAEAEAAKKNE